MAQSLPSFDLHQFAGHGRAAYSGPDAEVSYSDTERMHVIRRSRAHTRQWTPNFVFNDKQLRRVIAERVWRSGRGGRAAVKKMPEDLANDLDALKTYTEKHGWATHNATSDARSVELKRRHLENVTTHGSYVSVICNIAYLAWRAGFTSKDIAEKLNVSRELVRVNLCRMRRLAEDLGFDAAIVPHGTRGRKYGSLKSRGLTHELRSLRPDLPYRLPKVYRRVKKELPPPQPPRIPLTPEQRKVMQQKYGRQRYALRYEKGICCRCERPRRPDRKSCQVCIDLYSEKHRQNKRSLRPEFLVQHVPSLRPSAQLETQRT
jgi:hypothetical protein